MLCCVRSMQSCQRSVQNVGWVVVCENFLYQKDTATKDAFVLRKKDSGHTSPIEKNNMTIAWKLGYALNLHAKSSFYTYLNMFTISQAVYYKHNIPSRTYLPAQLKSYNAVPCVKMILFL